MDKIINIDWLAFSMLLIPQHNEKPNYDFQLNCPVDCRMDVYPGNNIFQHRAIISSLAGEKLFTILWNPYSRVIDKRIMLVEIANIWLYGDWWHLLKMVNEVHSCQFHCISRLDLCCDFNPTATQYKNIHSLTNGDIYIQSKREGSVFFDQVQGNKVQYLPKQISWGSKNSSIKWKLYNKVKEITSIDEKTKRSWINKPYIVDCWKRNGLKTDDVWRLEISLSSASKYQFNNASIDLKYLRDINYVKELYSTLYLSKFVQRKNQGHKDKSNDKRVDILNFKNCSVFGIRPPMEHREIPEFIPILRSLVKQTENPSIYSDENLSNQMLSTINDIVGKGHLKEYFNKTFGCPIEKYMVHIATLRNEKVRILDKPIKSID